MSSRRASARPRSLTLEDREHEIALRARTALNEQTKGDYPIFAEQPLVPARHNPFARLGDGGLRAVEVIGLVAFLGLGFGYLVPSFTWPPSLGHVAALAAVLASCAGAVLASHRLAENRLRIATAGLHWKIADTGVFVSEPDADAVAIRFVAWSHVAVAESHRGRVVLLDAKGDILADLNNPEAAQEMLQVIQNLRARRGEGNPGEVRGPRIEPRFDYPERLDAELQAPALGFDGFDGPVDLDALRHQPRGHDLRREPWIEPPRAPALQAREVDVVDADFVEVLPAAEVDASPAQTEAESPIVAHAAEDGPAESRDAESDAAESPAEETDLAATAQDDPSESGDEASADQTVAADTEKTVSDTPRPSAEIDLDLARSIDEGIRGLFEPIAATVVPEAVRVSQEASTRPVPVDASRALPGNDDPVAGREDTVMRRLMEQLATTADEKGVDPHAYVVAGVQDHLQRAGEANANPDTSRARVA